MTNDYADKFLSHGLFKYSRHPNFFAEQTFWVAVYLFAVAATGRWVGVTGLGASLLIMNFHFSTNFSEVSLGQW